MCVFACDFPRSGPELRTMDFNLYILFCIYNDGLNAVARRLWVFFFAPSVWDKAVRNAHCVKWSSDGVCVAVPRSHCYTAL